MSYENYHLCSSKDNVDIDEITSLLNQIENRLEQEQKANLYLTHSLGTIENSLNKLMLEISQKNEEIESEKELSEEEIGSLVILENKVAKLDYYLGTDNSDTLRDLFQKVQLAWNKPKKKLPNKRKKSNKKTPMELDRIASELRMIEYRVEKAKRTCSNISLTQFGDKERLHKIEIQTKFQQIKRNISILKHEVYNRTRHCAKCGGKLSGSNYEIVDNYCSWCQRTIEKEKVSKQKQSEFYTGSG